MKLLSTLLWLVIALSSAASHAAPVTRFIHNDALGSPVAATDQNGDVVWKEEYKPFGERIIKDSKADTQKRWFTGHVQDKDTGLVYMGARFYDPSIGRFLSPDPVGFSPNAPMMFNRYAYANNNPYKYIDPDGNSPISVLAKQVAKNGFKQGIQSFGKRQTRRLGRYMNNSQRKEFSNDLADVLGTLDSSPVEIAIEMIPIAGDIYGTAKFTKQVSSAFDKMQNLENKWVQQIIDSLPPRERKKFINSMRNAGVRDAKMDQGVAKTGSGFEGHHKTWVSKDPSQSSDPRNIEFLTPSAHKNKHR